MTPQGPATTPGTTTPVPTPGAVASTPSVAIPPAAPAPETGRYTLQVGAFSDLARARAVETSLRGRGVGARVVRIPGSELFRVRIGYFASREAALREVQDLERRGVLNMDAMVRDDADQERTPA
jgi:DedD protein